MDNIDFAKKIVSEKANVIAAFGNSSILLNEVENNKKVKRSLDFVFIVDNIKSWHQKNYKLNKSDYSLSSMCMLTMLPKSLIKGSSNTMYNIGLNKYDNNYKYGLIEMQDFITNIYDWNSFYSCSYFLKPIYSIKSCTRVKRAIEYNRQTALLVSLMILNKSELTISELLEQICILPYYTNIEILLKEKQNKVKNIVNENLNLLKEIYLDERFLNLENDKVLVDLEKVFDSYYLLPNKIINNLIQNDSLDVSCRHVKKYIANINKKQLIEHKLKEAIVNGPVKSLKYVNIKNKENKNLN